MIVTSQRMSNLSSAFDPCPEGGTAAVMPHSEKLGDLTPKSRPSDWVPCMQAMGTIFVVFGITPSWIEPTNSQSQGGRPTIRPLTNGDLCLVLISVQQGRGASSGGHGGELLKAIFFASAACCFSHRTHIYLTAFPTIHSLYFLQKRGPWGATQVLQGEQRILTFIKMKVMTSTPVKWEGKKVSSEFASLKQLGARLFCWSSCRRHQQWPKPRGVKRKKKLFLFFSFWSLAQHKTSAEYSPCCACLYQVCVSVRACQWVSCTLGQLAAADCNHLLHAPAANKT